MLLGKENEWTTSEYTHSINESENNHAKFKCDKSTVWLHSHKILDNAK